MRRCVIVVFLVSWLVVASCSEPANITGYRDPDLPPRWGVGSLVWHTDVICLGWVRERTHDENNVWQYTVEWDKGFTSTVPEYKLRN